MNQYIKLINTVTAIVDQYGSGILYEQRFWNILSDTFPFAQEYALRDEFKRCIRNGYVTSLAALQGEKDKTYERIYKIISAYKGQNEDALRACLYSIAIAVGTCTLTDYDLGLEKPQYSGAASSASSSNGSSSNGSSKNASQSSGSATKKRSAQNPYKGPEYKDKFHLDILGPVTLGLLSLFISSLLYLWHIAGGADMGIILIGVGIIQWLGYFSMKRTLEARSWSVGMKIEAYACYLPIMIGYFVNALFPLLLLSDSIADTLYNYFTNHHVPQSYYAVPTKVDFSRIAPDSSIALFFSPIVAWIMYICTKHLYSDKDKWDMPRYLVRYKYAVAVALVITLGYVAINTYPLYGMGEDRAAQCERQLVRNGQLRESRKDATQDLSVKGIRLGEPKDSAIKKLKELNNGITPSEGTESYFGIKIDNPEELCDKLLGLEYKVFQPYPPAGDMFERIILRPDTYFINTTLDNHKVTMRVFVHGDKVAAILVEPNWTDYDGYFPELFKLYKHKYGEPEVFMDFSYEHDEDAGFGYKEGTDRNIWHFKNGAVQFTDNGVVYVSADFEDYVRNACKAERESAQRAKEAEAERKRREQIRKDSITRQKLTEESIRQARNHANAINEI